MHATLSDLYGSDDVTWSRNTTEATFSGRRSLAAALPGTSLKFMVADGRIVDVPAARTIAWVGRRVDQTK